MVKFKAAVLGLGHVGKVIAVDLYNRFQGDLVIADVSERALENAAKELKGVETVKLDASNIENIVKVIKGVDLSIGALPGKFGMNCWLAAVKAGVNLVDISFTPDDPFLMDEEAKKAGVTIIPDAGVAPGLTNVLAGRAYAKMNGKVDELTIYVGAIPEKPSNPLGYVITWNPEDLIEEYTRPARVIHEGVEKSFPALSGLENLSIKGLTLEAFRTDGLRTMLRTLKGVRNMEEKTLRWPGHVQKILLLKELGFLDFNTVKINGQIVSPAKLTARLFKEKLTGDPKDILIMLVRAKGQIDEKQTEIKYVLIDRYDQASGVTALSRTTGYTATGMFMLLSKYNTLGPGIIPPEIIGMDEHLFSDLIRWLEDHRIKISK